MTVYRHPETGDRVQPIAGDPYEALLKAQGYEPLSEGDAQESEVERLRRENDELRKPAKAEKPAKGEKE